MTYSPPIPFLARRRHFWLDEIWMQFTFPKGISIGWRSECSYFPSDRHVNLKLVPFRPITLAAKQAVSRAAEEGCGKLPNDFNSINALPGGLPPKARAASRREERWAAQSYPCSDPKSSAGPLVLKNTPPRGFETLLDALSAKRSEQQKAISITVRPSFYWLLKTSAAREIKFLVKNLANCQSAGFEISSASTQIFR